MFYQGDLFEAVTPRRGQAPAHFDLPTLIARIADVSPRPRYAFMVLNLIAKAAGSSRRAGPYIVENGERISIRDWLSDSLVPMAGRDARRRCIVDEVRAKLVQEGRMPSDPEEAARLVQAEVRDRVRRSGRCNVSRAVSDLVRAGLVRRHYEGYRVDHHNRGARREAVYTITEAAAHALQR